MHTAVEHPFVRELFFGGRPSRISSCVPSDNELTLAPRTGEESYQTLGILSAVLYGGVLARFSLSLADVSPPLFLFFSPDESLSVIASAARAGAGLLFRLTYMRTQQYQVQSPA